MKGGNRTTGRYCVPNKKKKLKLKKVLTANDHEKGKQAKQIHEDIKFEYDQTTINVYFADPGNKRVGQHYLVTFFFFFFFGKEHTQLRSENACCEYQPAKLQHGVQTNESINQSINQ